METNLHAAFTGHRTYDGRGDAALRALLDAMYARGFRTFLSGMAVGFDLAAAEAVLALRSRCSDVRLVAVIPFAGQERRYAPSDRARYAEVVARAYERVVLRPAYGPGCYRVRNDFLVEHADEVVAWYDGSTGGTRYTVGRALRLGLRVRNLCPEGPVLSAPAPAPVPTLF